MTPEEKANELFGKYYNRVEHTLPEGYSTHENFVVKQCALIAVDEIMEFMRMDDEYTETASNANSKWVHYWIQVKEEIEKI